MNRFDEQAIIVQLKELQEKFPKSFFKENKISNSLGHIYIPDFKLSEGWNKSKILIIFEVLVSYPFACPAHFYSDRDLMVCNNGHIPKWTNPRNLNGIEYLYHYICLKMWSPNYDTLLTYARVIQNRFRNVV